MKSIESVHVRIFSWLRGHDRSSPVQSCKEQYGKLCCCTTCCDLSRGIAVFLLSFCILSWSLLIHPLFSFWYLVLYAYTVYKYIYMIHIFLYLCLLLSWEWCDYVIIRWSLIMFMLTFLWISYIYIHNNEITVLKTKSYSYRKTDFSQKHTVCLWTNLD